MALGAFVLSYAIHFLSLSESTWGVTDQPGKAKTIISCFSHWKETYKSTWSEYSTRKPIRISRLPTYDQSASQECRFATPKLKRTLGRRLGDRFREHLLHVKNNSKDVSKPVARHFNLPGHSDSHMTICGISLHCGTSDSRKRKEQSLIFKLGTLAPNGINERFSFS